jgi:hypothetical protein
MLPASEASPVARSHERLLSCHILTSQKYFADNHKVK